MICQSCNGVIGRDCFNPQECMAITRDMADRYRQQDDVLGRLDSCEAANNDLRAEIAFLNGRIEEMNEVFGKVRMRLGSMLPRGLAMEIDQVMIQEQRG